MFSWDEIRCQPFAHLALISPFPKYHLTFCVTAEWTVRIRKIKNEIGFRKPIIGLHVRHGDACTHGHLSSYRPPCETLEVLGDTCLPHALATGPCWKESHPHMVLPKDKDNGPALPHWLLRPRATRRVNIKFQKQTHNSCATSFGALFALSSTKKW